MKAAVPPSSTELTDEGPGVPSGGGLAILPDEFYQNWSRRLRPAVIIQENSGRKVPERLLQQIWWHQRILRDKLRLIDGRPLQVLHPGFWNRQAGPDFQGAVLRIGDATPITGDVEVDREESGWRSHGHAGNPAYARVILHVIWNSRISQQATPLLALEPYLEAPLDELADWLDQVAPNLLPASVHGRCAAPLAGVSMAATVELLIQAARSRLKRKACDFGHRARHVGWESALMEGLMFGLGYRHNVWPMRRLAELTGHRSHLEAHPSALREEDQRRLIGWEARLLGLAGLLSEPARTTGVPSYLRTLWDAWWQERAAWHDQVLPSSVWRFAGIRPANHPHRRIALGARWMAGGPLSGRVVEWLNGDVQGTSGGAELRQILEPIEAEDSHWRWHWTLRSQRLASPQPLLGEGRTTDLAMNVVLPWLLARAMTGDRPSLIHEIERRYFAWPAAEDNAVLRQGRQRLMGAAGRRLPGRAALQQGLIQINREFCETAGALCTGCRFPEMVAAIPEHRPP